MRCVCMYICVYVYMHALASNEIYSKVQYTLSGPLTLMLACHE